MRNVFKLAALMAALASTTAYAADLAVQTEPAVVADPGGFYIGSLNSLTFMDDTNFSSTVPSASVNTDYDVGYYSAFRAGYSFGSYDFVSPRVELEVGYGRSDVDTHTVNGVGAADSFGSARNFQGYVNGYIDVPTGTAFTPYFGGGIGAMNLKLRRQGADGVVLMNDSDTAFAYHLDAGVGVELNTISFLRDSALFANTTFDIGYRYTGADNFDFTAVDGTPSSTDFKSHAITAGFRRQF
ncbi:outer membrane beta-barrel protein [uncultured Agrobacterium sp.]|uniref:outer membrane protein n=1 Tax=uncultured Agrobacterium sp. TaxID=157277 RepID=UPI0025EFE8EA|nr:outer membrane beta-barrel protein [uncultured Agrobacterium sp.]